MKTLELSKAVMFATLKASMKLPHRASAGQSNPLGTDPDGCSAVVNMLANGTTVIAMSTTSSSRPVKSSARAIFIARWRGQAAGSAG